MVNSPASNGKLSCIRGELSTNRLGVGSSQYVDRTCPLPLMSPLTVGCSNSDGRLSIPIVSSNSPVVSRFSASISARDFLQPAHGCWLIEIAGETDLVASLDAGLHVPCIRRMGQDLALQEALNTALFRERDLFRFPQLGIRLVLDHREPALKLDRKEAGQRVRPCPLLVDPLNDGRCGLIAFGYLLTYLDLLALIQRVRVCALQP